MPGWMIVCALAAAIALFSEVANRRRNNRKNIDDVGFMPWPFITAMALLVFGCSLAIGTGLIDTSGRGF